MSIARRLKIDMGRCLGCRACAQSCPSGLISCHDINGIRRIRFIKTCSESCTNCADACSEKAIHLSAATDAQPGLMTFEFPLARCSACGNTYHATEKMIKKLRTLLSTCLRLEDPDWAHLCLSCRRAHEAQYAAGRGLM